jgi:hypothetical protein
MSRAYEAILSGALAMIEHRDRVNGSIRGALLSTRFRAINVFQKAGRNVMQWSCCLLSARVHLPGLHPGPRSDEGSYETAKVML